MALFLLGAFLVLLGVLIELSMGSFRHWADWSWPRRSRPMGGTWVKIMCGRIGLVAGLALMAIGVVVAVIG